MTIKLIEGFDVYPDVHTTSQGVQARWLSKGAYEQVSICAGRFGGQGIAMGTNAQGGPPQLAFPFDPVGSGETEVVLGFAFLLQASTPPNNTDIMKLLVGGALGACSAGIGVNSAQQPFLFGASAAAPLVAGPTPLSTGSWHYLDLVFAAGSPGSLALYLDGVESCSINTANLTGDIDTMSIGSDNFSVNVGLGQYDDIYLATGNARLGERRVETLYPNANNSVGWTPLAKTNWQEVSEPQCDGDASYVSTSTAGASDLYAITSLASNPLVIDAVQTRVANRKDDGSSHVLHTLLNSQGTQVEGADFAVAGTYLYDCDIHPTDPDGGGAWTTARVNGALIGQKLVS